MGPLDYSDTLTRDEITAIVQRAETLAEELQSDGFDTSDLAASIAMFGMDEIRRWRAGESE